MTKHITLNCLNINGLNDRLKQDKLKLWIEANKSEVLTLVDTRIKSNFQPIARRLKASSLYATPSDSNSGGIAFLSLSPNIVFSHMLSSSCSRLARVHITHNSNSFFLVGVYAPVDSRERRIFFSTTLPTFLSSLPFEDELILCGDFNFVEDPHLDRSFRAHDVNRDAGWSEFVTNTAPYLLTDCFRYRHSTEQAYTYFSHSHNTSSRLDRVYISPGLLPLVSSFAHCLVWQGISDHQFGTSITVSPSVHPTGRNEIWRLNSSYLGQRALSSAVRSICSHFKNPVHRTGEWWDDFKRKIRKACQHHSHMESARIHGQVKALQRDISLLTSAFLASPNDIQLKESLHIKETQLQKYLNRKIAFMRTCATSSTNPHTVNILKLLSNRIKEKKAQTFIKSLRDESNNYENTKDILHHASAFYSSLYNHTSNGSPNHPIWTTPTSFLPESLSQHLNLPITIETIKNALDRLPCKKTPGIDGLPKELYTTYWKDIGPLFLEMVHEVQKGKIPKSLLKAATVLIYKKGDRTKIENYRPISLLNTDYKIIAKILSIRLTSVLRLIIHPDQSGFVRGRSIQDTLYTILDTFDHCNTLNRSAYLFLLDLRKAYDTLDRTFLFKALSHLGLPETFISMIRTLHTSTTTQLYVNGSLGPDTLLASGVRQGCPIAPQLFIWAIELFHRFISSVLPAFRISPHTSIRLSCYADDITIYFEN